MFNLRKRPELPLGKLLTWLAILILGVVILHVVAQLSLHRGAPSGPVAIDFANRLNVDDEMSVPTWLASLLGIVAGTLALIIARVQKTTHKRLSWYLLAVLGFFISVDEAAAFHELLLQALHIKAGFGEVQTLWQNAWLLILPFVAVGMVAVLVYWYHNMPRRIFARLLIGITVYMLGAVVVEYASIQIDKSTRIYTVGYVVVEEGLEYFGLWLMIRACLMHVSEYENTLRDKLAKLLRA